MTDVRSLSPPEWCNWDRNRSKNADVCHQAYGAFTRAADGVTVYQLCEWQPANDGNIHFAKCLINPTQFTCDNIP